MTSQSLRIAMIAPPWFEIPPKGYGGIELVSATLTNALVKRGHYVTLISAGINGTTAHHFQTFSSPQTDHIWETLPESIHLAMAQGILTEDSFDIVHDHTLAGALCAPWRPIPTVITVHGPVDGEFGDYYSALGEKAKIIALSQAQLMKRPSLNWVGTVHNGINIEKFPFSPHPGDYALWLARYHPEKGPDLAIEICRQAKMPLVMAGKLNERLEKEYFDDVVKPLAAKADVELLANVNREQVVDLLGKAKCLLHPARFWEPCPGAVIEALACGNPVVGTRKGAIPEIVEDTVTGWLHDDPAILAELIHRVDEIDRQACRARAERLFSADAMAEGYEKIYLHTIAEQRATTEQRGR